MENLFTPQELAVKLKELGFDENCFGYWRNGNNLQLIGVEYLIGNQVMSKPSYIKAPTWEQAFDYFRKIHKIESCIHINYSYEILGGIHTKGYPNIYHIESDPYKTYKEARLKCLIKLIEICNEKE